MLQAHWLSENGYAFFVLEQIALVGQWNRRAFVDAQIPPFESLQCLVAGSNLPEQGASQLRWDAEFLTDDGVESAGETVRVQLIRLENLLRHPASGSEEAHGHIIEMRRLSNFHLDCANCFQYVSASQTFLNMSTTKNNPTKAALKGGVSTQLF